MAKKTKYKFKAQYGKAKDATDKGILQLPDDQAYNTAPLNPNDPWLEFYAQGGADRVKAWEKEGWNADLDYQKNQIEFSRGTGQYDFHPAFKAFNVAAQLTTGVANKIGDVQAESQDRARYIQALQSRERQNYNENGLNDLSAYAQYGGKYQVGGQSYRRLSPQQMTEWNSFLDFVGSKGLTGSKNLDSDPTLVKNLFAEYKKANGSFSLDETWVPDVQNEFNIVNGQVASNAAAKGQKQYLSADPSKVDGIFGHRTSTQRFVPLTYKEFQNGDLVKQEFKGLIGRDNTPTSVPKVKRTVSYGDADAIELPDGSVVRDVPKRQMGGPSTQPVVVEAEEGEVYQTPEGHLKKVNEGSGTHEEGGVMVNDADRILEDTSDKRKDKASRALKLSPALVKALTGYESKKELSHSSAMELAQQKLEQENKQIESKLKKNVASIEETPDKRSEASLKFNMMNLQNKPSEQDVFDALFEHQEMVKQSLGIQNPKAQYGGKYQVGGQPWNAYAGGRELTPTGQRNAFNFTGGLDSYKQQWKDVIDLSSYKTASEAQGAVYDYLMENAPEAIDSMWQQYGNTKKGMTQGILRDKFKDGKISGPLSPEERKALRSAYTDDMFGARTMLPSTQQVDIPFTQVPDNQAIPADPALPPQAGARPKLNTIAQPKSRFREDLHWYDVAGPVAGILEGRTPVNYNGREVEDVRMNLQNPLPVLQAGQRDFNTLANNLPQNGQGYANQANLFAKKYALNDQVLGQYENINNEIKNKETLYNANAHDQQSVADQQAREMFEQKWLGSKEALRQQHAQSWDDLNQTLAQNNKLNREGNMLMKMFPAFDQYGEYNGYQVPIHDPLNMGIPSNTPNTTINQNSRDRKAAKQQGIMVNGKFVPFTKKK